MGLDEMGRDGIGLGVPKVGWGKIQQDGWGWMGLDVVGCDGTRLDANGTRPQ